MSRLANIFVGLVVLAMVLTMMNYGLNRWVDNEIEAANARSLQEDLE